MGTLGKMDWDGWGTTVVSCHMRCMSNCITSNCITVHGQQGPQESSSRQQPASQAFEQVLATGCSSPEVWGTLRHPNELFWHQQQLASSACPFSTIPKLDLEQPAGELLPRSWPQTSADTTPLIMWLGNMYCSPVHIGGAYVVPPQTRKAQVPHL